MWCKVSTQEELNAAIERRCSEIEITAEAVFELRIPNGFVPAIKSLATALVRIFSGSVEARESSRVVALGSSRVEARGSSRVVALESSRVEAWGSSRVEARGSSRVVALESSRVEALESSRVEARESSSVVARGSSRVVARGSSSVEAWGSSSVVAWGSSRVEARGSSRVVARGSSSVEAWGSSRVEAWGSSRVEARGSSSVEARGVVAVSAFGLQVKASLSALCSAHLHDGATCEGGVQIVVKEPVSVDELCEYYGVEKTGLPNEVELLDKIRGIVLSDSERLDMSQWHGDGSNCWGDKTTSEKESQCGTTHCLAGWAQVLVDDPSIRRLHAEVAGKILIPSVADKFYVSDNDMVLEYLERREYAKAVMP